MRKITKDQKIKALERLVKAIFGRQDGKIEYRGYFEGSIELIIECDVDDAVKNLGNLEIADIDCWFYTGERKLSKEEAGYIWNKKRKWEGYTEICLTLNPIYWKEVEKLKEELKKLKKDKESKIKKVKMLKGRAKQEAEKKGLKPNDLVIVRNGIEIEKIVGDPVSYLLKHSQKKENQK